VVAAYCVREAASGACQSDFSSRKREISNDERFNTAGPQESLKASNVEDIHHAD
jgi:hypothetical protein